MSVETVTQGPVLGVKGRRVVVGREGTPALGGLGTSVPGLGTVDVGWLLCAAWRWSFAASLLGCRGALTREKPTSVGKILVFVDGVSVSPRLWEGLRGWLSWRGTKIPRGSCLQASVEQA